MSSNRSVTYTLLLNSNVRQVLAQTEQSALSLDRTMESLRSSLMTLGIGLAAREIVNAGKEWVEGAADYETAMLRIKNASKDVASGFRNQFFITDEVNKLKLDLQESADSYGQFLLKIKNSGLTEGVKNQLYDNLAVVGKVGAIPASQIAPAIRDVAIMLGEGELEARHLRALLYVHPQLTPFIADELGLKDNKEKTKMQQLLSSLSSGKLTKSAIDPRVLIDAIQQYRDSVEHGLPESLKTITSETNELSNAWLGFKNNIVLDLKPELISLFHEIEGGIKWMKEHREIIEKVGKIVVTVGLAWVEYKAAMLAVNLATGAYNTLSSLTIGESLSQASAFAKEATAAQGLAAAIAEVNASIIAMNQQQIISGLSGGGMVNAQLRAARGEIAAANAAAGAGVAAAASPKIGLATVVMPVVLTMIGYQALNSLAEIFNPGLKEKQAEDFKTMLGEKYGDYYPNYKPDKPYVYPQRSIFDFENDRLGLNPKPLPLDEALKITGKGKYSGGLGKDLPKHSSIRGNSVTNIHIDIKEMNGMNRPVFQIKDASNLQEKAKDIGVEITKVLSAAVNDSQLVANTR